MSAWEAQIRGLGSWGAVGISISMWFLLHGDFRVAEVLW